MEKKESMRTFKSVILERKTGDGRKMRSGDLDEILRLEEKGNKSGSGR